MSVEDYAQELLGVGEQRIKVANQYYLIRKKHGQANVDLNLLLTPHLKKFRESKKNLGIDMAIKMLMAIEPVAVTLFKESETSLHEYKGLDRLLDAYEGKMMALQSIMKYNINQEKQYEGR